MLHALAETILHTNFFLSEIPCIYSQLGLASFLKLTAIDEFTATE